MLQTLHNTRRIVRNLCAHQEIEHFVYIDFHNLRLGLNRRNLFLAYVELGFILIPTN